MFAGDRIWLLDGGLVSQNIGLGVEVSRVDTITGNDLGRRLREGH